jgi:hypothetical protein
MRQPSSQRATLSYLHLLLLTLLSLGSFFLLRLHICKKCIILHRASGAKVLILISCISIHLNSFFFKKKKTIYFSDKAHDQKILRSFFRRDLVIFRNFDWFRSSDVLTALVWLYSCLVAFMVGPVDPSTPWKLWYYIGHAAFWRIVYNGALGLVLHMQSDHKFFSRHFIKYGETPTDAFSHWKM